MQLLLAVSSGFGGVVARTGLETRVAAASSSVRLCEGEGSRWVAAHWRRIERGRRLLLI
jgi:hypothetical protein